MNGNGESASVQSAAPLLATRSEAQQEQEKTYQQMPQPGGESAEQDEDAAQLRLGPDLQNCACLFSSEIVQVLEANKNVMTSSDVYEKTLAYASRFSKFKNAECVHQVRLMLQELSTAAGGVPGAADDALLVGNQNKNGGLVEFEVAQLCSLCPETADEAIALIPSLARIQEDDLDKILADIANFRKFK